MSIYEGSNTDRQRVGEPGHCDRCAEVGHIAAHPHRGCADVGCYSDHTPPAVPSEGGALAEAEEWLRSLVGGRSYTARALAMLLAEYDRRDVAEAALDDAGLVIDDMRAELARCRKVVQAATALVGYFEKADRAAANNGPMPPWDGVSFRGHRRRLAAEVAALSDTEGSGTDAQ